MPFPVPLKWLTGVVDFQRALELEDLLRHHPIAKISIVLGWL